MANTINVFQNGCQYMRSRDWEEKQTMKFKGTLIVVKDCRKALKYYRDMFGFELIRDHDGNMELSGNLYLQEEKYWERFTGRRIIPQNNQTKRTQKLAVDFTSDCWYGILGSDAGGTVILPF